METNLPTHELVSLMLQSVANNWDALIIVIAAGAGLKIFLDILFKFLYNISSSK